MCSSDNNGLSDYLYMLLFGQGLHGLAGTALYTIAPAYIDGSVSAKQSPTYLGEICLHSLLYLWAYSLAFLSVIWWEYNIGAVKNIR